MPRSCDLKQSHLIKLLRATFLALKVSGLKLPKNFFPGNSISLKSISEYVA